MSDWGTPLPELTEVRHAAVALEQEGYDVHTVRIVLNGQHGGFDVEIEATDEDLEDYVAHYRLERHGHLEQTKAPQLLL